LTCTLLQQNVDIWVFSVPFSLLWFFAIALAQRENHYCFRRWYVKDFKESMFCWQWISTRPSEVLVQNQVWYDLNKCSDYLWYSKFENTSRPPRKCCNHAKRRPRSQCDRIENEKWGMMDNFFIIRQGLIWKVTLSSSIRFFVCKMSSIRRCVTRK
jgi:hypothetical protein